MIFFLSFPAKSFIRLKFSIHFLSFPAKSSIRLNFCIEKLRWPGGLRIQRLGVRAPLGLPSCVLEQDIYTPKVLVIHRKRWLRPDMTEKVFTGTLCIKQTKCTEKLEIHVFFSSDLSKSVNAKRHLVLANYLCESCPGTERYPMLLVSPQMSRRSLKLKHSNISLLL